MNQNQNPGQRNYAEVGQGGSNNPRWEPTKNEQNPQYPRSIEGYFKSFREMPGTNGSFMVAEIQLMNPDGTLGTCADVSGGKVLENKLNEIQLGSWVMIEFKGKVKGKGPNTYNDWKTFVDENAVPLHQLLGTAAPVKTQAFAATPAQAQQPVQPANPFAVQGNAPVFTPNSAPQSTFGQVQQNAQVPAFNQGTGQVANTGNGAWIPPANNTPVFNSNPPVQAQQPAFGQGQPAQNNNVFGGNQFSQVDGGGDLPF